MSSHRDVNDIQKDLNAVEDQQRVLRREMSSALDELAGVKVGDVVMATKVRRAGRLLSIPAFVVGVRYSFADHIRSLRPHLTVQIRRKDGSWGDQHVNIHSSWEPISEHQEVS